MKIKLCLPGFLILFSQTIKAQWNNDPLNQMERLFYFFQHQNTEGKIKIQKLDVHGFHQFGDSGKTLIKSPCCSTSSGYFGIKND